MESAERYPPLIRSLLQPQNHQPPVQQCELVETHISWVILAGDKVYKIKKPLNLGFLDFSTLEKRRFYCQEELRLNRRLAPDIYQQVVAIGGSAEKPQLNAQQDIFEYAVQMRRFPQQAQLDRVLERGELTPRHIDAFARMAAAFHGQVAVAEEQSGYGEPQQVWRPVAENFMQIREHLQDDTWQKRLNGLEQWSRERFERLEPLLRRRKEEGFIRECHGDMHLRNLAWIDGRAVAFDCIEFNPALRWIDVISEIAFLVMDLKERGEARLAQRFLNTYLELSGDYEGMAVLSFYLVYRALVRAKVAAIRSDQSQLSKQESDQALQEFDNYLAIAEGYTEARRPALIVTRGMSASGKSTLTGPLLEQLGAIRLRSDVERKRLFGMRAEEDGRAPPGEGIYSAAAGGQTYDRLAQLAAVVLDAGYTVIVDAACLRRVQRDRFYQLAMERNVPCLLLALEAPAEELRQRIRSRTRGASDADLSVLEHQLAAWRPLDEDEKELALVVDTARPPDAAALLRRVSARLFA